MDASTLSMQYREEVTIETYWRKKEVESYLRMRDACIDPPFRLLIVPSKIHHDYYSPAAYLLSLPLNPKRHATSLRRRSRESMVLVTMTLEALVVVHRARSCAEGTDLYSYLVACGEVSVECREEAV